jgi:hypothetical protein
MIGKSGQPGLSAVDQSIPGQAPTGIPTRTGHSWYRPLRIIEWKVVGEIVVLRDLVKKMLGQNIEVAQD